MALTEENSMGIWNYVATAHKPTKVTHACVGNFTGEDETNLILAKCNRIEILLCDKNGNVETIHDIPIYGTIATLQLFQLHDETQALLFISTEEYKFCVLEWDRLNSKLISRDTQDVAEPHRKPRTTQVVIIDPEYELIGLHLYNGLFKVLSFDSGHTQEALNIRLKVGNVLDIKFLFGCSEPTIAVLYQDMEDGHHVKTYMISLKDKCFVEGSLSHTDLDYGAHSLISVPPPLCGLLIIGGKEVAYRNTDMLTTISITHSAIAYGMVDGSRYLLGGHNGSLSLLVITHEKEKVTGLQIEHLGETSIASSISCINQETVYIGSIFGDSQLIKLDLQAESENVKVLKIHANLGPIVDFCMIAPERKGLGELVTCSGSYKDGSLRIVCNTIGVDEQILCKNQSSVRIWAMKLPDDRVYLILSSVQATSSLLLNPNGEPGVIKMKGFNHNAESLFCHEAIHNQLLQVTSESVKLVSSTDGSLTYECRAPSGWSYGVATANATQILLATSSIGVVELVYLEIGDGVLQQILKAKMEYPVSCLDLTSIGENPNHSDLAAVGFWIKYSVSIYSLPDLIEKINVDLGPTVPRSVLFCAFEGIPYLLCGRGDGDLFYYLLNTCTGVLTYKKVVSFGGTPIALRIVPYNNTRVVLAVCYDRSIMIYSRDKELLHSYVNLGNVHDVCPFSSSDFPDSYAIMKENVICVGTLQDKQRLQVCRSIPLGGEHATSVCYQQKTNTIAICSVKSSLFKDKQEKHYVRTLDDRYFEFKSSHSLEPGEQGQIIISCSFSNDARVHFCVGTAYPFPMKNQSTEGRILVFSIGEGYKFELIAQLKTKGKVYCLHPFNGKLLALVGSCIQIYDWVIQDDGTYKLQSACRPRRLNIFAHSVLTRGDSIILGDFRKTIVLLLYNATKKAIELVGRTHYTMYESFWVSNVELIRDNAFLVASSDFNLITGLCFSTPDGRFQPYTKYHLGEHITRFRHGSLAPHVCSETDVIQTRSFSTRNGGIGIVASLPEELFRFLRKFQLEMSKVVDCVGGLSHTEWRGFNSINDWSSNFLDGDLIESYPDLQPAEMEEISGAVNRPIADLLELVEKLRRLH